MDEIKKLLNQSQQRAGLLAVISGVLETTSCEVTKQSIANSLTRIFSQYVVDDEIERITLMIMKDALEATKNNVEAQMKEMMNQINDILKN